MIATPHRNLPGVCFTNKPALGCCVKAVKVSGPSQVQRRAMKMVQSLRDKKYQEILEERNMHRRENGEYNGNLSIYIKGVRRVLEGSSFNIYSKEHGAITSN